MQRDSHKKEHLLLFGIKLKIVAFVLITIHITNQNTKKYLHKVTLNFNYQHWQTEGKFENNR